MKTKAPAKAKIIKCVLFELACSECGETLDINASSALLNKVQDGAEWDAIPNTMSCANCGATNHKPTTNPFANK